MALLLDIRDAEDWDGDLNRLAVGWMRGILPSLSGTRFVSVGCSALTCGASELRR